VYTVRVFMQQIVADRLTRRVLERLGVAEGFDWFVDPTTGAVYRQNGGPAIVLYEETPPESIGYTLQDLGYAALDSAR